MIAPPKNTSIRYFINFTYLILLISILPLFVSCSPENEDVITSVNQTTASHLILFTRNVAMENDLFERVNMYRISLGKTPFEGNIEADNQASEHTIYMIEENKISHDFLQQRTAFFLNLGYVSLKENVASGYTNAQTLLDAWLQSELHRLAIEADGVATGISVLKNEAGIHFITQIYLK